MHLTTTRLTAALAAALALAACGGAAAPAPVPELPRIVQVRGPAPHEWTRLPLGADLVIEVELRLADGSLATDYLFSWGGPINSPTPWPGLTVLRERPAPGRERLVLRSTAYNYIPGIGCLVQTVDPSSGLPANQGNSLGPFNVVTWGGAPAGLALPPAEVRLGVGERRPFVPLAGPVVESNQVIGKPSHLPVTVTSSAPAVVRVEADGVTLTALAEGTATLTATAGGVTRTATATVDARPLGPPTGVGFRPAAPRADGLAYFPIVAHTAGAVRGDYHVAVDGRGYPYLTAKVNFTLWLAGWTGTDAGWEPVSAPGEEVDDPGSTTVDGRGRLYVVYRTFGAGLVLAERDVDAPASTWTRRPLFPLADLWATAAWQPTFSDDGSIAVHPREGGGVWIAYAREFHPEAGLDACRTELTLFEVTDDAVVSEQIAAGERAGDCGNGTFTSRWQTHVHVVGVRPGRAQPDLFLGVQPNGAEGWYLAAADGGHARLFSTGMAKPARPEGAEAMGIYLPYDDARAAELPPDAPRLVYPSTMLGDSPREYAGVVFLPVGGVVWPVQAARLHAGQAVGMRMFNETLIDAVSPFAVTALP